MSDRERPQVVLANGNKQDQVPAHELRGAVDYLRAHGGFGQVGQPKDERSTRLHAGQLDRGPQVVGLARLAGDQRQRIHHLPQVGAAAPWRQPLLRTCAISQQAHLVAGIKRQARHGEGR